MFDFEKEEMAEATEEVTPSWVNGEWDQITDAHATEEEKSGRADARQSPEATRARIYRKINAKRRERTAISAVHYAMLAIGLSAVAWIVRDITGLAIFLCSVALLFGLVAAFGAGKVHEM